MRDNFTSVHYAMARSRSGGLTAAAPFRIFYIISITYLEVMIFIFVSVVLFGPSVLKNAGRSNPHSDLFRRLAIFGLIVSLLVIVLLRTDNFSSRWLAPFLFALPMAVFSTVKTGTKTGKLLGFLCIFIAVSVLAARGLIGFSPDTGGKVERIHIPYEALSQQLTERLKGNGVGDVPGLVIISGSRDEYIATNLMACLHAKKFVRLKDFISNKSVRDHVSARGGIFLCHVSGKGKGTLEEFVAEYSPGSSIVILESPYLRSSKLPPFVLGVVMIPKREVGLKTAPLPDQS